MNTHYIIKKSFVYIHTIYINLHEERTYEEHPFHPLFQHSAGVIAVKQASDILVAVQTSVDESFANSLLYYSSLEIFLESVGIPRCMHLTAPTGREETSAEVRLVEDDDNMIDEGDLGYIGKVTVLTTPSLT